jgi:hypothetical protein
MAPGYMTSLWHRYEDAGTRAIPGLYTKPINNPLCDQGLVEIEGFSATRMVGHFKKSFFE